MENISTIYSIITLLLFIYAMMIVPRSLGEAKGVYMETPDPFFGKFEADCKWKHGTTYLLGTISFIIIIPLLIVIFKTIMDYMGINMAIIILVLILIVFKFYYDKQKAINTRKAYEKNVEDGYIKPKEEFKIKYGITQKLIRKFRKD